MPRMNFSLASVLAWLQNQALTLTSTLTINKTSGSGDFETIASMTVSDVGVSSGYINFRNANGTNGVFAPWLDLRGTGTSTSLLARANVPTDSGTNPVFQFDAQTTGGSAITTRPIFNLSIANATVLSALPLNSGASMALSHNASGLAAPTFTSRSAGVKYIYYPQISGSLVDFCRGVETGFMWDAVGASTNGFKWYGGTTEMGRFTDAGFLMKLAGQGIGIKEGTNATMGAATLVGGTVTVSTTKVTASSRIFLTSNTDGGTPGWVRVSARTAGTSFTITSSSGTDTSTIAWLIVEPQ